MRFMNPAPGQIMLYLDEEASQDAETSHVLEDCSVFVAE